jgi:hypothetical protein
MYSPDFIHLAKMASRFGPAGDEYLYEVFKKLVTEHRGEGSIASNDSEGAA